MYGRMAFRPAVLVQEPGSHLDGARLAPEETAGAWGTDIEKDCVWVVARFEQREQPWDGISQVPRPARYLLPTCLLFSGRVASLLRGEPSLHHLVSLRHERNANASRDTKNRPAEPKLSEAIAPLPDLLERARVALRLPPETGLDGGGRYRLAEPYCNSGGDFPYSHFVLAFG